MSQPPDLTEKYGWKNSEVSWSYPTWIKSTDSEPTDEGKGWSLIYQLTELICGRFTCEREDKQVRVLSWPRGGQSQGPFVMKNPKSGDKGEVA